VRALTAQFGKNKIDNELAQARRTFTRHCQTIVNKQTLLQNLPRSASRLGAE
jgi:hypothetical protein